MSSRQRVIIITGANTGLGFSLCQTLASPDTTIIMACRDISKAKQAISDMNIEEDSKKLLIPMKLNLANQASVRECAAKIHSDYPEGINILVNNAGVYAIGNPTRMETDDGHELHFGTNHLGHFTFTLMLLDLLQFDEYSKIIHRFF